MHQDDEPNKSHAAGEDSAGGDDPGRVLSRRQFLKIAGMAGATVGMAGGLGGLLAGCAEEAETTTTAGPTTTAAATTTTAGATTTIAPVTTTTAAAGPQKGTPIKLGVVAPKTGGLAFFSIASDWWLDLAKNALKDGIIAGDKKLRNIEFLIEDSQSDTARAAQVAAGLISDRKVNLIMSFGSPDTVVPVSDQAEALGCPSIGTNCPWQSFTEGRGMPKEGFKWTYLFGLGSEQTMINFTEMFDQVPNNKVVGMLFANDIDAQGWMAENAAPKILGDKGYKLVVPSFYPPGAEDFTQQISMFKKEGCDIVCGTNNPPEFTNFWKQCYQQGFRPKLVSSGKCLLFPETLQAFGEIGYGLIGEVAFHPVSWPFVDAITGMDCAELAADYEAKTGNQWTQVIGTYTNAQWAVDVFKRATDPEDPESVVQAIRTTKLETVHGQIDYTAPLDTSVESLRPSPNICKQCYAGGQWVRGDKYPFDLVVCSVAQAPGCKVQAKTQPMQYT